MAPCSRLGGPLSQNQLRNHSLDVEPSEIDVLGQLLSGLLARQASQPPISVSVSSRTKTVFARSPFAEKCANWNVDKFTCSLTVCFVF